MFEDAAAYLAEHGVQTFRASGAEITFHCMWCPDGDQKGKGKCYLNTETWLWDCKRCGTKGNRRTLLKEFGDEETVEYIPGSDPGKRRAVLEAAVSSAADMLLNNPRILKYLMTTGYYDDDDGVKRLGRGLSADTIDTYQLGYVPKAVGFSGCIGDHHRADIIAAGILTDAGREWYSDRITIPYRTRGTVVSLRGKDPNGKYFTAAGDSVRLFNSDSLAGAQDAIICEGEFDALVLQQKLQLSTNARTRATAVVAIPGAGALPTGFESYFSDCKRVFIALDPDDVGKKGALRIKEMLGSKARIVELPEDLPKCDWTEFLSGRGMNVGDVMELLATAAGKRLWSTSDTHAKWKRQRVEAPGMQFGFSQLDGWYAPGAQPGDLIVALAKTGVGKTNLLTNVTYNTRSRPSLFLSCEMTAVQVYDRLRRIAHFWNPFASDLEIDEMYRLLRIVDTRLVPGDVTTLCAEYEEEMGFRPQQVMVDYLGYAAKSYPGGNAYERTTNAVMGLKEDAKLEDVVLWTPSQVNRMAEDGKPIDADSARDAGTIEETADLLVSLYRPADAIEATKDAVPSGDVRLGVLKNRHGAIGMATSLRFSAASLVLVDGYSPRAILDKVAEENRRAWRGDSYESIYAAQAQTQLSLVSAA
jgi:hypothetical protein